MCEKLRKFVNFHFHQILKSKLIAKAISAIVYSMDMEFAAPKEKKNAKPSRKPANGVIFANSAKCRLGVSSTGGER